MENDHQHLPWNKGKKHGFLLAVPDEPPWEKRVRKCRRTRAALSVCRVYSYPNEGSAKHEPSLPSSGHTTAGQVGSLCKH